jgi:HEAT repeat protein
MTRPSRIERWRGITEAGYAGQIDIVVGALDDDDPVVRELALGAAERSNSLSDELLVRSMSDPVPAVRRRAVELAAARRSIDVLPALHDHEPIVVEQAAWTCGEHEVVRDEVLARLIELATGAAAPLVREAAVAALGAIGDERGLVAVLAGCTDQPAIRRRAVLALAPFSGPEVDAALERALADRDWQVRQAAEVLAQVAGDD